MNTPPVPNDSDIFYTYPRIRKPGRPDLTKAIASKYLVFNGSKMVAPVAMNPEINLYKSLNADGKIDEATKFENVGNYLVVPANYDPSEATAFANLVNNAIDLEGFLAGSVAELVSELPL
jgi:hypothetical protein